MYNVLFLTANYPPIYTQIPFWRDSTENISEGHFSLNILLRPIHIGIYNHFIEEKFGNLKISDIFSLLSQVFLQQEIFPEVRTFPIKLIRLAPK